MAHNLIASDRVEGTSVCRLTGEKIGEIQRLMIDKVSGKIAYAAWLRAKAFSRSMGVSQI